MEAIHAWMRTLLPLDGVLVCYHTDEDRWRCRKPLPGMLVDAAVVVVENIEAHHSETDRPALSRLHVIYRAVREVAVPVTAGMIVMRTTNASIRMPNAIRHMSSLHLSELVLSALTLDSHWSVLA